MSAATSANDETYISLSPTQYEHLQQLLITTRDPSAVSLATVMTQSKLTLFDQHHRHHLLAALAKAANSSLGYCLRPHLSTLPTPILEIALNKLGARARRWCTPPIVAIATRLAKYCSWRSLLALASINHDWRHLIVTSSSMWTTSSYITPTSRFDRYAVECAHKMMHYATSMRFLRRIDVSNCEFVRPSLCVNAAEIDAVRSLTELTELKLSELTGITVEHLIAILPALKHLLSLVVLHRTTSTVRECRRNLRLTAALIGAIACTITLQSLQLDEMLIETSVYQQLSTWAALKTLHTLVLSDGGADGLSEAVLPRLASLASLRRLDLRGHHQIVDTTALLSLAHLTTLQLHSDDHND